MLHLTVIAKNEAVDLSQILCAEFVRYTDPKDSGLRLTFRQQGKSTYIHLSKLSDLGRQIFKDILPPEP